MNKYMGFYELKALSIPSVPWKIFTSDTVLDDKLLWTVRVATAAGDDLNLPRAVGVDSEGSRERPEISPGIWEKGHCFILSIFYCRKERSPRYKQPETCDRSSGQRSVESCDIWEEGCDHDRPGG